MKKIIVLLLLIFILGGCKGDFQLKDVVVTNKEIGDGFSIYAKIVTVKRSSDNSEYRIHVYDRSFDLVSIGAHVDVYYDGLNYIGRLEPSQNKDK